MGTMTDALARVEYWWTPEEMQTIGTTPRMILQAAGVGKIILPVRIFFGMSGASVAYSDISGTNLFYGNPDDDIEIGDGPKSTIQQVFGTLGSGRNVGWSSMDNGNLGTESIDNKDIVLWSTSDPCWTVGDGLVHLSMLFTIESVGN